MATIFKHELTGQILRPGKSWRDENRTQQPGNWQIWNADYKASMGITEIVQESSPDPRLYTWSYNDNGTINNTAKPLDGVKSSLRQDVNKQQGSLLLQTDWMYIRKIDKGEEIYCVTIQGKWMEFDTVQDFKKAGGEIRLSNHKFL